MGRPPLGKRAMNTVERQQRYWERKLGKESSAPLVARIRELEAALAQAQAERRPADAVLSDKGKIKLDDAIRIHKKRLDRQFEQRVNEEVRRRIDAADDSTRASNKELRLENFHLQRILGERGVFTETQYKQMLVLCHPDNSSSPKLKAALLQILLENKKRLVKPAK